METDTDIIGADVGVLSQIEQLHEALTQGVVHALPNLVRFLHATLDPGRLLAALNLGVKTKGFASLKVIDRLQLLRYSERVNADAGAIRAILDSLARAKLPRGPEAIGILPATETRLEKRRALTAGALGEALLIPFGGACMAWTMPNRWGMRRTADIPFLFNPMALAVHRPGFLFKMVAGDFDGYLDPSMLKVMVSTNGVQMIARADGGALWNHCVGPFWSANQFEAFRDIMSRHLQTLRRVGFEARPELRVYLFNLPNVVNETLVRDHVVALAEVLATRVKGRFVVVGVDTCHRDAAAPALIELGDRVALIRAPPPTPDYHWAKAHYYNRADGVAYEYNLLSLIAGAVEDWVHGGA